VAETSSASSHVFKWSRVRWFGEFLLLSQVSAALFILCRSLWHWPSYEAAYLWFVITLPAVIVGGLIVLVVTPTSITVTPDRITGPGVGGRVVSIPLSEIDRTATRSHSAWRWLGGRRVIYGLHGARIYLNVLPLGPANVRRIFALVGCSQGVPA